MKTILRSIAPSPEVEALLRAEAEACITEGIPFGVCYLGAWVAQWGSYEHPSALAIHSNRPDLQDGGALSIAGWGQDLRVLSPRGARCMAALPWAWPKEEEGES